MPYGLPTQMGSLPPCTPGSKERCSYRWLEHRLGRKPEPGVPYAFIGWVPIPIMYRLYVGRVTARQHKVEEPATLHRLKDTTAPAGAPKIEKYPWVFRSGEQRVTHTDFNWEPEAFWLTMDRRGKPKLNHETSGWHDLWGSNQNYKGIAKDVHVRDVGMLLL